MSARHGNIGGSSGRKTRGGVGAADDSARADVTRSDVTREGRGRGDIGSPVGQPLPRVDGVLKVRGKARFAAEVPFRGLAYAALTCSTIAKGRITSIKTADARSAPGVLLVLTHENAPKLDDVTLFPEGATASTLNPLRDGSVHWNGQPVALVLAETQEQADYGASLIRVHYEQEPARLSLSQDRAKSPKNILGEPTTFTRGDAEAALADSAVRVDNVYRTPRYNQAAIELHALTCAWEGDSLVVHDTTQMVHATQITLAKIFGLPPEKVRVLSPFVGGGFGNKMIWDHHIFAIAAAKMARRPVRMVLSREGVFRLTGGRTFTEQRVALGANTDGTLKALIHTGIAGMTSHNNCPEQFTFPARHLYASKTFLLSQKIVELDMVANSWMRAPGESVGTFALESAIDEVAHELKMDPIELRARIEPKKDPTTGKAFSERSLVEAYRRGAERFGWSKRSPIPGSQREGDWLIGYGVATATYPYYRMPGGAARIRLMSDGHAIVQMGSHEMGMGTATVQAQLAAELLGLPVDCVRFEYGDSSFPSGTVAGGSSQSASIAAAVTAARDKLIEQLLRLMDERSGRSQSARSGGQSPLAGLEPKDVEPRHQGLAARNVASRFESYASILTRAGKDEIECEAPAPKPQEAQKFSMHSSGAQFCEVRVNQVTGETRVARWLGSFDTGRILNARTAASQFRGGIIMGIGLALTEDTLFDERTGRIMNPSIAEYHVPVHLDVPRIEVMWNDIADPQSPSGVRGIGEIGITGAGAAVANAVFNATGRRVRELPITLDKLL
jgi:xanthine dehydrogenase YagR molybdenum-binding subunit